VVGQVSGKVTFEGQPVTEGVVSFFSSELGYASDASLGPDGSYTVVTGDGGLVVGKYQVAIMPPTVIIDPEPKRTPPVREFKKVPNIPPRYHDFTTS
jgi:hypothetical protein